MANLPSFRQLLYLVALADLKHFTRAAAACFVTQPTLSAGIAELESVLGCRLVERNRSQVLLTPLGAEVALRARQLLAAAADLGECVRAQAEPLHTTLRLGAIPTIAPFVLPVLVQRLRAAHPGLSVLPREDTSAQLVQRLRDGRLDAAILALPYALDGLDVDLLAEDQLLLAVTAGDAHGADGRLDGSRLLLMEEGHCLRDHTLIACGAGLERRGGAGVEASSLLTLLQMVAGGFGSALVPAMALRSGLLQAGGVEIRQLQPAPSRGVALVSRPTYTRPQVIQVVAQALRLALAATATAP